MKKPIVCFQYLFFFIVLVINTSIAQDCYQSTIVRPSPFMGNHGEIFQLEDESLWRIKYEYEYLYAYYPQVIICPAQGKLIIANKSLNVQLVASPRSRQHETSWTTYEETHLQGMISGTVQQGDIFKTSSGNIYEVTGLTLQLVLELSPRVIVLKRGNVYKLIVEGFDEPLICRKLN